MGLQLKELSDRFTQAWALDPPSICSRDGAKTKLSSLTTHWRL